MAAVLINGINYSSSNVSVILLGFGPLIGVTEINYEKVQTIEDNYELGPEPNSRGYGQNAYTGNVSMYKDLWNSVIDSSPSKDPAKRPMADLIITFGGQGVPFRKETVKAINFKNNPMAVKSGDTKLTCKIDLAVGGIEY